MSDSPWDDDDARALLEDSELEESETGYLDPEDIFTIATLDRERRVKLTVELRDKDEDCIPLKDVIEQLLNYIKDKTKSGSSFNDQIMPLMAQAMVGALGRLMGIQGTAVILAIPDLRQAFAYTMGLSFLLLKFIQKKELRIHLIEQQLTEEEFEALLRRTRANNVTTLAAMAGENPREVVQEMLRQGKLTQEDVTEILGHELPDNTNDDKSKN
jgi:hypothetical protein